MSGDKTEDATPRKLQKARERGEVWKSADVTHTAQFATLLGLAWLAAHLYLPHLGALFDAWPAWVAKMTAQRGASADAVLRAALQQGVNALVIGLAPAFAVVVLVALLALGLQVRGVFSFDPITPKPERLNPGSNLKRLVSTRNLVDLAKTLFKVGCVSTVVWLALRSAAPHWVNAVAYATPVHVLALLARSMFVVSLSCLAVYLFVAGVDYAHQFFEYAKQQRMSKDEVVREYKDVEGDPHVKGHRRALAAALAQEGPSRALGRARAVVTNPTHLSVAIGYEPGEGALPTVLAKGSGTMAMALRREAKRLRIPIVENKPLARRLYAHVGVGSFVTADVFADVARLLASVPAGHRGASDPWRRL
jgi:type III secretion protein U